MKILSSAGLILALGLAAGPALAQSTTTVEPMQGDTSMGNTRPSGKDGIASGAMGNMTKKAPMTDGSGMNKTMAPAMDANGAKMNGAPPIQQN